MLCMPCQVVDIPEHMLNDYVQIGGTRGLFKEYLVDTGKRLELRDIVNYLIAATLLVYLPEGNRQTVRW